jgi:hypothetical protein
MQKNLGFLFLFLSIFLTDAARAQTPDIGITANLALGDVTAIDAAKKQISLKTKDGEILIVLADLTVYKRVSPEAPTDLKAALPSAFVEISVGDRVIAQGKTAEDKKTIAASRVIIMTKSDIAKKQSAESERWSKGVVGRVTAVNVAANEITVAMRGGGMMGERNAVVAVGDKTQFRRYAPGSVKFSDARLGTMADIKVGDQLRARGERSADGARLAAEEIVSGSFKMVAGKITAIDAAKREVTISDAQTNKPVVVAVNDDTLLRRFPPEMAQRMAMMQAMRASGQMPPGAAAAAAGAGGGQGAGNPMMRPPGGGGNPAQTGQMPQGMGGQGGGGVMRGGDVDQMLERMPALNLTELKVGDAIAASSTVSAAAPDRVTAIKFVAGIEPFLNAPQLPGGGNRPQASSAPSINIPGLDGIGAP